MIRFRRISYCSWPLDFIARGVASLLYRVRAVGREHVPATGGVLIVANHLSYADVAVIQLACPRPLRFIGYRDPRGNRLFDWVFKVAGVIGLSGTNPAEAIRASIHALQKGEAVCLFPEGMISRTGQLMQIQRGFELIARKAAVPVIPAAIDGLWGSIFSFSANRYLWKPPRLTPTPVAVVFFGPALPAARLHAPGLRQALLELSAEAFSLRPRLQRSVGYVCACALAGRPRRTVLVDCSGAPRPVKAAAVFAAGVGLARRIRQTVPEARVGIALPPGAGCVIANLAVMWAGKTPVNLNFTAGKDAGEAALQRAGVRTVLSADILRTRAPNFPWPERTLDLRRELDAAGGRMGLTPWYLAAALLPRQWAARLAGMPRAGGDREAALLFTSGSAGKPKAVVYTHRNLLANCEQISSLSILPRSAVILGCLPIFHSFGFTVTLIYPLVRPCGLVTVPSPLDTRRILDAIREERATVLVGAPTFLRPLLKKGEPRDLASLELVVAGAEKLPEDLRRDFLQRFHLEILEGYGLTEASPVTNFNQPHPPVTTGTAEFQAGRRAETVGRLVPGLAVKVIDPDTREDVGLGGKTGLLCLRGSSIFTGYLDEPEATAAAIQGGWFVTGDLAHFDQEGFLTIAGRRSRFSKIGGEMVPHGVVEQKLATALGLDPGEAPALVVTGVPDPVKGEAIVLLSTVELDPDRVRTLLTEAGLPNLWIPKVIKRVPAIPLLPTGKLDLTGCNALARA